MVGKSIRIERIIDRNSRRTVIVPMDHGVTLGPIEGLKDMKLAVDRAAEGGANAVVLHKGVVSSGHREGGKDIGLIIHLSGSTSLSPNPNAKVDVCTVEEAIQLGADAVSLHINFGAEGDREMMGSFGCIARKCADWGIPLIAMTYTRGPKVKNEYDVKYVKHAARAGAELGADIVKCNYTGDPESFREVVEGCLVPVVIAGGEKVESDRDLAGMVAGALKAGASGVSIGRNVFQHRDPARVVEAISGMVHQNWNIDDTLDFIGK